MTPKDRHAALVREAIRLHQRYQLEIIERFSVCPWAKSARLEGRTRTHVVVDLDFDPVSIRAVIDAWAKDARAEVGFVIVPRFDRGHAAFAEIAEVVGSLRSDVFLSAPFHPRAPAPGGSGGTIHFLRQSPDPTVQLVRRSRLDAIRAEDPPHYADIFRLTLRELELGRRPRTVAASVLAHNERLLEREGRAALQAIIDDIRADRARTYSTFDVGHAATLKSH